jgi:choline dehydrogenase-like flavoprotein
MIADGVDLPRLVREAEVVVIGAGACGLYLMHRLAALGRRVLVIESGGRASFLANDSPGQSVVQAGRGHTGIRHGRAFGLGGTTAYWGGQLAEFDHDDFRRGWPNADLDLRQWYDLAYANLGMARRPDVARLRGKFGRLAPPVETDAIEPVYTYWLDRPNFAQIFKSDVVAPGWPCLVTDCAVLGLVCDGGTVAGLRIDREGALLDVSGKRVVIATGTVAAADLLLKSSETGSTPWSSNDNIGRSFQDHLGGKVAIVELHDERKLRDCFENGRVDGVRVQPKLKFREGRRGPLGLGIVGMMGFESSVSEDIANLKHVARSIVGGASTSSLAALPATVWRSGKSFVPLIARYLRDGRVRAFFDRELSFRIQAEQLPVRDSRIVRRNGETVVDWRVDGRETGEILSFAREAGSWLERHGIGRLKIDPLLELGDPAFLDTLVDTYHQAGGLCMADSANVGVTDPNGRIWGTDRLYVAGASLFPTSSHANVTLTAIALAGRLAAHLDEGLRR